MCSRKATAAAGSGLPVSWAYRQRVTQPALKAGEGLTAACWTPGQKSVEEGESWALCPGTAEWSTLPLLLMLARAPATVKQFRSALTGDRTPNRRSSVKIQVAYTRPINGFRRIIHTLTYFRAEPTLLCHAPRALALAVHRATRPTRATVKLSPGNLEKNPHSHSTACPGLLAHKDRVIRSSHGSRLTRRALRSQSSAPGRASVSYPPTTSRMSITSRCAWLIISRIGGSTWLPGCQRSSIGSSCLMLLTNQLYGSC